MNFRALLISCLASWRTCSPVLAFSPGSAWATRSRNSLCEAPVRLPATST